MVRPGSPSMLGVLAEFKIVKALVVRPGSPSMLGVLAEIQNSKSIGGSTRLTINPERSENNGG